MADLIDPRHTEQMSGIRKRATLRTLYEFIGALALSASCAVGPAPLHVYVGDSGDRSQADADDILRAAASMWGRACGVYVQVETAHSHDDDAVPVRLVDAVPCPASMPKCAGVMYSARSGRPDTIYAADGRPDPETVLIVAHEIGHALGVPHIDGTLMSPFILGSTHIPSSACDRIHAYYR